MDHKNAFYLNPEHKSNELSFNQTKSNDMLSHRHFEPSLKIQKKQKASHSVSAIALVAVLLSAFLHLPAFAEKPWQSGSKHTFQFTVTTETDTFKLNGESEFIETPSSYSINMIEENGRCVIHMLNFSTPPGPGIYDVENTEAVRTAIVCILDNADPRERLASHSGTFTITELTSGYIKGHFDMILKGPISGKEFHISGEVSSENIPSNLKFNDK